MKRAPPLGLDPGPGHMQRSSPRSSPPGSVDDRASAQVTPNGTLSRRAEHASYLRSGGAAAELLAHTPWKTRHEPVKRFRACVQLATAGVLSKALVGNLTQSPAAAATAGVLTVPVSQAGGRGDQAFLLPRQGRSPPGPAGLMGGHNRRGRRGDCPTTPSCLFVPGLSNARLGLSYHRAVGGSRAPAPDGRRTHAAT
jgi:hypothetical protein